MMVECYDKWWLPKDMNNMGYIFEYCDEYCIKLFNTPINKEKLLNAFMKSEFRKEMEQGHPKFLSQASIDSIKQWIKEDYNNDIHEFIVDNNEKMLGYIKNQMFWVGWIYAYIHFMAKMPSERIIDILPIEYMTDQYYTGHEINKSVYFNSIKDKLAE